MLNRRTLRIKIMQSLFAFEQCREANYGLALDQIEEHFKPNLNSMEVQDRELLKGRRKAARQLLEKKFSNAATPEGSDAIVNAAVKESVSQYHKHIRKDFLYFRRTWCLTWRKSTISISLCWVCSLRLRIPRQPTRKRNTKALSTISGSNHFGTIP